MPRMTHGIKTFISHNFREKENWHFPKWSLYRNVSVWSNPSLFFGERFATRVLLQINVLLWHGKTDKMERRSEWTARVRRNGLTLIHIKPFSHQILFTFLALIRTYPSCTVMPHHVLCRRYGDTITIQMGYCFQPQPRSQAFDHNHAHETESDSTPIWAQNMCE